MLRITEYGVRNTSMSIARETGWGIAKREEGSRANPAHHTAYNLTVYSVEGGVTSIRAAKS